NPQNRWQTGRAGRTACLDSGCSHALDQSYPMIAPAPLIGGADRPGFSVHTITYRRPRIATWKGVEMRQYVNWRSDAGASLIDVVVGIVLAAVVITIGVGIMRQVSTTDVDVVGSYQVQRELQNTQSALYRDVVD